MATKKKPVEEKVVKEENVSVEETPVEEKIEVKKTTKASSKTTKKEKIKKNVQAMKVNCNRLYVRDTPSATGLIKGILSKGDVVMVHLDEGTDEFYKIQTPFINGYCMKQFIG